MMAYTSKVALIVVAQMMYYRGIYASDLIRWQREREKGAMGATLKVDWSCSCDPDS